jgi:DivIVA domain-containing protein
MGIPHDIDSWAFIVLAAASASRPLSELVRARRRGARLSAIPAWVWSGLFYGLTVFAVGVLAFHRSPGRTWLNWILVPLFLAGLASLAVPGIVSRRRDGVPWWRFWVRVIPPPSAAAGPTSPGPAITLDARTSGLIGRIEKVTFSTTRLSTGYDEEEVDVFLDKVIAVLSEGGQPDQAELRGAHFTTTRLRPGYVRQDVDGFLHEISRHPDS